MTSDSGSSGGGSSGGSSEKNKSESISKSTGKTTSGIDSNPAQSLSGGTDYSKAPASTVAGTGEAKDASSPYSGSSIIGGGGTPQSISQGGGGGGPVGTTVNQAPAAGAEDGPEGTTITAAPRSDYSVVLAGQVGNRPNRSPSRSNNFVSIVGSAGGLGRTTSDSKRTLIGGA